MKTHIIIPFLLLLYFAQFSATAQFNEQLEKEILALSKKYQLDGIERARALDRLEEITPVLDRSSTKKELSNRPWRYSHTVSSTARKYRQSNAIYKYELNEGGDGFFADKYEKKTYVTWNSERSSFLEIDWYKSAKKEERTRRDFLGIHSITNDRFVLTMSVKSKQYTDKSSIIFLVYFSR